MVQFKTGNDIVDSMGKINFAGNIVPQIWYKTIQRDNGKPYLLAITILSDIVYWYRPSEIRDEASGQVIGWKKRFKEDLLQRSYDQFANIYGETKRSIVDAVICLEKLGVIKREFRTIRAFGGIRLNNVLFLKLDIERLYAITYPSTGDKFNLNKVEKSGEKDTFVDDNNNLTSNNEYTPTKFSDRVSQNFVCPISENNEEVTKYNVIPSTSISDTNTKITAKNKNIDFNNHIIQSEVEDGCDIINTYELMVKKNIDYDLLIQRYHLGEKEEIDEIIALIVEMIGIKRKSMRISGTDYPYAFVKDRFLKINSEHIVYVLNCLHKNTSKITNIKSYLLATLFNSVNTINSYYQAEVNHGMYEGCPQAKVNQYKYECQ